MSLKAFHLAFITLSIILAIGFAIWLFAGEAEVGVTEGVVGGICSLTAGVGLIAYAVRFMRKLKNVSYL
jgi:hypothetical protein